MTIEDAIEDAKVEWSEDDSPYEPVATITYPVQDAYSDERRSFGDDVLDVQLVARDRRPPPARVDQPAEEGGLPGFEQIPAREKREGTTSNLKRSTNCRSDVTISKLS